MQQARERGGTFLLILTRIALSIARTECRMFSDLCKPIWTEVSMHSRETFAEVHAFAKLTAEGCGASSLLELHTALKYEQIQTMKIFTQFVEVVALTRVPRIDELPMMLLSEPCHSNLVPHHFTCADCRSRCIRMGVQLRPEGSPAATVRQSSSLLCEYVANGSIRGQAEHHLAEQDSGDCFHVYARKPLTGHWNRTPPRVEQPLFVPTARANTRASCPIFDGRAQMLYH
jgi:hypothetical protein